MWGKRRKRRPQLPRQLAHALLVDAMGRVEQREGEHVEPSVTTYPGAVPQPTASPGPPDLRAADVPVDNSAGLEPLTAADESAPPPCELPAQRSGDSTSHGTFG
jgi:hypothetical protein